MSVPQLQSRLLTNPFIKTGLWLLFIAVAAGLVQLGAWLLGVQFNILSQSGGRGVLLGLALAGLAVLMATDRRPAADYGLAIGDRWPLQLVGGFWIGVLTYAVYAAIALLLGGATLGRNVGFHDADSILVGALTSFPVALIQQIIFSGYLVSVFRDKCGRIAAVAIPAALFALLTKIDSPAAILSPANRSLVVGLFFTAAFLGALRLHSGGILLASGLMAGWITMGRLFRKTQLFDPGETGDAIAWLWPQGDPRQAPIAWLILAVATGVLFYRIGRYGEGKPAAAGGTATSFKRYFPLSSPSLLAPLDLWLGRLWDARFQVGWRYLPRLAATLALSAINTIITLPERLILPLVLRGRRVPDPVFVLGVHRSGTTHLHNLLALDPQFTAPRTYHTMNPLGCLFSGWIVTPFLGVFLPGKRPMDDVRFHLLSPQEEEFALLNMTRLSPYWGVTFPRRGTEYDRCILVDKLDSREQARWKSAYLYFLRQLTFFSGNRPLLKNPYNTGRLSTLLSMFPQALVIHIHRHPFAVYRSNVHLAREGHCLIQVQDPDERTSYESRYLENYRAMEEAFYGAADKLPPNQIAELRFEDLERDPVGQIERIYRQLGLELSQAFRERLTRYLGTVAEYKKNRFDPMPEETRRRIHRELAPFFARWGYETDLAGEKAA